MSLIERAQSFSTFFYRRFWARQNTEHLNFVGGLIENVFEEIDHLSLNKALPIRNCFIKPKPKTSLTEICHRIGNDLAPK